MMVVMYLAVCGSTRVVLDELDDERLAYAVAANHEAVHRCGAWVQPPLVHHA